MIVCQSFSLSLSSLSGLAADLGLWSSDVACRRRCLTTQTLAAANEGLKHCRQHDDRGGREQLQGGRDVVELQDVGERAEHDGAGDGADHRAGAAEQAGAADDHGGDRGQLVADAVIGAAEIELAGMDDAGERRGEAGDRVDA